MTAAAHPSVPADDYRNRVNAPNIRRWLARALVILIVAAASSVVTAILVERSQPRRVQLPPRIVRVVEVPPPPGAHYEFI